MSATEGYFVTRTMRALELLAFGPVSARQLAAALQIHERTARRMLGRLVAEEYVTRLDEPRRRYVLTLRVAALASQAVKRSELACVAAPVVALLHTQTALTAHLVSPSYDCVLCLVHAAEEGTSTPRLRELVPAHCTAGGKTLLAARDRWRESLLSSPLRAYTDRTITDPGAVEQEAATTRERGYVIEDGEYRPGVRVPGDRGCARPWAPSTPCGGAPRRLGDGALEGRRPGRHERAPARPRGPARDRLRLMPT